MIVFRQLAKEHIREIVDILLEEVNERLEEYELKIVATSDAKDWLAKEGYDEEYGARPLRRTIQAEVEDKLSDAMLAGTFEAGDEILVDIEDEKITLQHNNTSDEVEEVALPAA